MTLEASGAAPPRPTPLDPAAALAELPNRVQQLHAELARVIVGYDAPLDAVLYACLARSHCLLVGVPGLAKTLFVQALGRLLALPFARIQFTPDLMPSDITGTEVLQEDTSSGRRHFVFVHGPVFTQLLLADEINRTPPKTQAALLEAMQEKTVTVAGKVYHLEEPFMVIATQNPIEQEGTYPLPEAQLDRFLFELPVGYPSLDDERQIVTQHTFAPLDQLAPIVTREELLRYREAVALLPAPPNVVDYAVRLVRATRPGDSSAPDYIARWLRWGASPRASQFLILAGRARAACHGRFNVACDDIASLAPIALRHRLIRSFQADADGQQIDDIIARLLRDVPRQTSNL